MYHLITSPQNQHVKRWKKLLTKKGRDLYKAYLIDGIHLLQEAQKGNTLIKTVMTSDTFVDTNGIVANLPTSIPIFQLPSNLFTQLTETEQSQGILAEIQLLGWDFEKQLKTGELLLLIDAVQDPGNLGTILRTAWAAGVDFVILGKGTVDPFNSKVVRSTMGALFHLPIFEVELLEILPKLKDEGIYIVGTSPHNGIFTYQFPFPKRTAILLGNEGRGIAPELLNSVDQAIMVPMPGTAESYNVSVTTAMVLYERIRQQLHKN